jgi:hypothetical protein
VRLDGLERPELAIGVGDGAARPNESRRRAAGGFRPRRAALDPFLEEGNILIRQLGAWRHLQFIIVILHRPDQPALLRLAECHNRPAVATGQQPHTALEAQAPLLLLAVTREAICGEERPDAALKKLVACLVPFRC